MPSKTSTSKMVGWVRRTPAIPVLLVVELLLVILTFWNAFRPLPAMTFTPDALEQWASDITLVTDEEGRVGTDALGTVPDQPLFVTPPMELPAGYYQVTVHYRAQAWIDGNNQLALPSVSSYTEQTGSICTYTGNLSQTLDSQTLDLYVRQDCSDARLMLRSNGAAFFLENLEVSPNRMLLFLLAVGAVLLLAAADLLLLRLLPGSPMALLVSGRGAALGILAIVFVACLPLLQNNGGMTGHDLNFHLQRIQSMAESLADGEFPVRVYHNVKSGYGYATSLYYGELLLYIPAFLRMLGMELRICYHLYLWGITAGTALVCYWSLREIFGRRALALIGCAFYVLSPYRLVCIYLRAAMGEYTAMLFLPLIVLGMWRLYTGSRRAWVVLAVGFGGLLQSHILTLILVTLVCFCIAVALWRRTFRPQALLEWGKAAAACVLVNFWFLLPFVSVASGRMSRRIDGMEQPGMTVGQLLTRGDVAIFGPALCLGGALFLAVLLLYPPQRGKARTAGICALAVGVFSLWASTDLFPWSTVVHLPVVGTLLGSIQFPWRFLGLATIALTLTALWGTQQLQQVGQAVLARGSVLAMLVLTLITALQFLSGYLLLDRNAYIGDPSQWMIQDTSTLVWGMDNQYLPLGAEPQGLGFTAAEPENVEVTAIHRDGRTTTVECAAGQSEGFVELPLLFYPGYHAREAGTLYRSQNGLVGLAVPAGFEGTITVVWQEPKRWVAADLVSLVTILSMAGYALVRRRKKN